MKQKEIERCVHINLNTNPKKIIETMNLELPTVEYFFKKDYGGTTKFEKHEDGMLTKALEEENSNVSEISEYISHKGNRWLSYKFAEYFDKAKYAQAWNTSFIYYETYGSCGAFFPLIMSREKSKGKNKVPGAIIYTSHFFQRMSERTGKAYRSRELIQEFITTMLTHASQADDEGEVIVKFKGGYGFGRLKCEKPMILEVRTYLTEGQLSNKQKQKCAKIDALAELIQDGAYLKNVRSHIAYNSSDTEEQLYKKACRNFELAKTLGIDKYVSLSCNVQKVFFYVLCDVLKMDIHEISIKQGMVMANEIHDCFTDFVAKYENYNANTASDEDNKMYIDDLVTAIGQAGRKLGLTSMTREAITKSIFKDVERTQ